MSGKLNVLILGSHCLLCYKQNTTCIAITKMHESLDFMCEICVWTKHVAQGHINQLHAVSCTQQGRQREPSNLDTRAKKWKYKFKWIFYLFEWGSHPQPVDFTVTQCAAAPRLASIDIVFFFINHSNLNRTHIHYIMTVFLWPR